MSSTLPNPKPRSSQLRVTIAAGDPLPVLQLRDWPLRSSPLRCLVLAIGMIALSSMIGWVAANWAMMAFAVAVFFAVTWRVWVPVAFELDVRGIQQIVLHRRSFVSWRQIASYRVDELGVLLLNEADAFPMSALQGLYIRGGNKQAELVQLVEFYCAHHSEESAVTVDM
jgi:hypothetical protein